MGAKFKKGDKILYGHDWDRKGKVDSVEDVGNGRYEYSITLDQKLETVTTNDFKSGLQNKAEWKALTPKEPKKHVAEKYLQDA